MSKPVKTDVTSGSRTFNRLDMQVSQVLHMAIELYDSLDYLFILDHYDDITMFDDECNPNIVSYYQMKTNNDSIQFNSAIKEDWFPKLYKNLDRPDWIVKELGLITNCPIKIHISKKETGTKKAIDYKSEATKSFIKDFSPEIVKKIRQDIATKLGLQEKNVDLSKFVHIRTTLSIDRHRDLVEKELGDFLYGKYPEIPIDSVKTIYSTMLTILTGRQGYEGLDEGTCFEEVKNKKGVSRTEFEKIIKRSILISLPAINDVKVYFEGDELLSAYEAYGLITEDKSKQDRILEELIEKIDIEITGNRFNGKENRRDYIKRVADKVVSDGNMSILHDEMYIRVLVAMVMINKVRAEL